MALALTSSAFTHDGAIPKQYTCQGSDISVPLAWSKLYALDTVVPDLKLPAKAQLEKAMQGHVLEKFELIGTYQKD